MQIQNISDFSSVLIGAIEYSPISVVITDSRGTYQYVNPKFCQVTGFSPDELIGLNARVRRSNVNTPEVEQSLAAAVHNGRAWSGEIWNLKKNGERILETLLVAPIFNTEGKLTNFVGMMIDVTERQQLTERVKASESTFRLLAKSITDLYFAVDGDLRVVFWNQTCEQLFAVKPVNAVGKTFTEIFPDKSTSSTYHAVLGALQEQKESVFFDEFFINGETLYLEGSIYPTGNGLAVIAKNVTDKHLLSIEINKKNLELSSLLELKDKFFNIVAHDLRSPFQSMLALSSALAEDENDITLTEMKDFARRLNNTMEHTYQLLRNLLEWSRMELGKVKNAPAKIQVLQIVAQGVSTLELAAHQKNIEIHCEINDSIYISADKYMTMSVLHNLLTNAIKFTNTHGKIKIDAVDTMDTVQIIIADNGIGMTTETLHKIFELGSGVTTKGTGGESGTGLGLILCREMMLRQGGSIAVSSEAGKGTTFTLTFPIWQTAELINN